MTTAQQRDIQIARLRNLVRAARETRTPKLFSMYRHVHPCGTPACLFGNYAARGDLQSEFRIRPALARGTGVRTGGVEYRRTDGTWVRVCYNSEQVREHFGIDGDEANELFGAEEDDDEDEVETYAGLAKACKNSPIIAAAYVEQWLLNHRAEVPDLSNA